MVLRRASRLTTLLPKTIRAHKSNIEWKVKSRRGHHFRWTKTTIMHQGFNPGMQSCNKLCPWLTFYKPCAVLWISPLPRTQAPPLRIHAMKLLLYLISRWLSYSLFNQELYAHLMALHYCFCIYTIYKYTACCTVNTWRSNPIKIICCKLLHVYHINTIITLFLNTLPETDIFMSVFWSGI